MQTNVLAPLPPKNLGLPSGPILDIGSMGASFRAHFFEKRAFSLLAHPNQMSFLTISNENVFSKT